MLSLYSNTGNTDKKLTKIALHIFRITELKKYWFDLIPLRNGKALRKHSLLEKNSSLGFIEAVHY